MLRLFRLTGPPLTWQIVGLMVGTLLVAQIVTLVLTIMLPPEQPQEYRIATIARVLAGGRVNDGGARPLRREIQADAPAPMGLGWLTSEMSRHELALLLDKKDEEIQLYFFTPLPFAGTARPFTAPERRPPAPGTVAFAPGAVAFALPPFAVRSERIIRAEQGQVIQRPLPPSPETTNDARPEAGNMVMGTLDDARGFTPGRRLEAPDGAIVSRLFPPRETGDFVPVLPPGPIRFGGPARFVQGDFIAAMKLPDGRWAVVKPLPESFPNSWQQRVLLWFLMSFALVAPLGWLFARRMVRPIAGFAAAAEQLGRDPMGPILPVRGPAEIGRAASAFNRMQLRLRSFIDNRTAIVGAIGHDLRTPLTRLRFRVEEAPPATRNALLPEIEEMEQMVSSVLSFMRDASEPGQRQLLDLRSVLESVIEDSLFIGKTVALGDVVSCEAVIAPLAIRRLLDNLVDNAVKYGGSAVLSLHVDRQDAVIWVDDQGPGLAEDELDRVFQPFYRTAEARASGKPGTGLGLAVCRSIARAHGGDVYLRQRTGGGLRAELRLPLR